MSIWLSDLGRRRGRDERSSRTVKLLLHALEERTVPTVSLFDGADAFVRNYAGATAIQQAVSAAGANAHVIVFNDESYSDFVVAGAGQSIVGRDVGTTYTTFPFQGDGNVPALGAAVSPQATVASAGAGATVTISGATDTVDNLNIVDGTVVNPIAVSVSGDNTTIANSTIQVQGRGVVVSAANAGIQITNNAITTGNTAVDLSGTDTVSVVNNAITSAAGEGIHQTAGGTGGVTIQGNAIATALSGIDLSEITGPTLIGGTAAGQGNTVIAGPTASAIFAAWTLSFGSPITIQGNTIQGGLAGVDIYNDERAAILIGGPTTAAGNSITGSDTGIFIRVSVGGMTIQNNTVTDVGTYGIRLSGVGLTPNFNGGIGSSNPFQVMDNAVSSTSGDTGLLLDDGNYEYHYYDVGTAKNNTISGFATGVSMENQGDVTLDHLTVTDVSTGISVDGGNGSVELLHLSVISGDYTARDRGIYADANGYRNYHAGTYVTTVSLSGVTITATAADSVGITFADETDATMESVTVNLPATAGNTATGIAVVGSALVVNAGNSIVSGDTGLQFTNTQYYSSHVAGNTLGTLSFTGQTGAYVDIEDGALNGQEIDGSAASFDGLVGAAAPVATPTDLAALYAVDGKVVDVLDGPGVGFVRLKAGYVFVSQADETSTAGAIQRGIDAAVAADTLEVQAGTFTGDLNVNKSLTLRGAQADADPVTGRTGPETTITGAGATAPIQIATGTDDVVIDGFTIESPAGGSGSLNAGIWTDGSTGVTIDFNFIENNTVGIAIGDSAGTISHNVISNNNLPGTGTDSGAGVWFFAAGSGGWTVSDNIFSADVVAGILVDPGTTGPVANVVILTNRFVNSEGAGISLVNAGPNAVLIQGNSLSGTAGGLTVTGIDIGAGSTATLLGNDILGAPGTGRVGVYIGGTAVLGDDTAAGANVITGWATATSDGVDVIAGGIATLKLNTITGNNVGVLVDGGTALLQDNDLRNNITFGQFSAGLWITNNAIVDAGQDDPATSTVEGTNFTGLGISTGDNRFNWAFTPATGYSLTGAKAIVNDNAAGSVPTGLDPVLPPNLPAQFNSFGTTVPSNIGQIVFDHSDDASKAEVDYRNPVGPAVVPAPDLYAVGGGPGSAPVVKVYNADGSLRFSINAYDPSYTGGVFVAVGDVNGDGVPDIITGAGPGGGPHVEVFNGVDGSLLDSFFAYASSFAGGVRVAAADVTGDGKADIITGAGPGGGPHVKVFDGTNLSLVASFFAYASAFTGGVFVAAGDVNGDGHADVVTGAGAGGGPHVKIFDGATLAAGGSAATVAVDNPLRSFYAFASTFTGGVAVAAGDVNGDGQADIITGAGPGGGPNVRVFSGADNSLLADFYAYASTFTGGVSVAAADVNGDGKADIVTGAGPGGGPHVKVFSGADSSLLTSFFAFDPAFLGGVYVG